MEKSAQKLKVKMPELSLKLYQEDELDINVEQIPEG
jgi:hypothetical protein